MTHVGWRSLVVLLLVLLASCTPTPTPSSPQAGAPAARETSSAPHAPKVLKIGIQREPSTVNQVLAGSPVGGVESFRRVVQNYLVVANDQLVPVPQLATEQISVENGTWRVNADGTMDTTWKLRPNIKWQDGQPFTSDDLLFSFNVYKDPLVPTREGSTLALMESASAPDPLTFLVHWTQPFVRANEAIGLEPLPRHLVEDAYRADKEGFGNTARFTSDFVGLGPYRITNWDPGIQAELVRFDAFYMGRPPLDTVIIRFIADENALVSNILAGDLDVVLPTGVTVESAVEVKKRWEGTGNMVNPVNAERLRFAEPQQRPEYARPAGALQNPTVRQALYSAIDRASLADVAMSGLSAPADSWISPTNPLRKDIEDAIPQWPYDPRRAQDLLAQAGWTRSGDGTLTQNGTPFEVEILGQPGRGVTKEQNIMADGWKTVGVQAKQTPLTPAQQSDREINATFPGFRLSGSYSTDIYTNRLQTSSLATAANRWSGVNQSGYADPQVDTLYDRLAVTITPAERIPLHRALAQKVFGDVAIFPLYWEVEPVLVLKGVTNVRGRGPWNMFEWDKN